ncbi:MAG: HypC/HybG/HupF family hydrogenase formation chaperone [Planctomycetota bacterium]
MCLAIPGQIESIDGEAAVVNIVGNRVRAMTALVPEVRVGDWVLVHAGLAVTVLAEEEARETLDLMQGKYDVESG